MKDAPLQPGASADDVLSGKRITVSHIDDSGATVEISDIPSSLLFERSPVEQPVQQDEQVVED
ncbi:hypothetical protein ALO94_200650 [Pseudomonas syringae pv. spinaceae]|uniref:ABC transporter n=2 Tax=Pseudomonas syringae TaxID=317 RepID=A0A0Q0CG65_PSESX|nr:hypothetical protein ALO94_200650 [Pseudomonas syringae pv. spinaceae]